MSLLVQKLNTGHSILFDKHKRELFVINPNSECSTVEAAERLVASGSAKKFDKRQLEVLQSALSAVVLLAATP